MQEIRDAISTLAEAISAPRLIGFQVDGGRIFAAWSDGRIYESKDMKWVPYPAVPSERATRPAAEGDRCPAHRPDEAIGALEMAWQDAQETQRLDAVVVVLKTKHGFQRYGAGVQANDQHAFYEQTTLAVTEAACRLEDESP